MATMYHNRGKYLHSSLARTLYERLQMENEMKNFDKNTWYQTNIDQYSLSMQSSFVQLNCDNETQEFLDNCHVKADSIITQILHTFATTFLAFFMTKTSINGLLGRGSMFVFSHQQFEKLMDISSSWKGENLLDLGAGDGKVTEIMASYFERISVTEASSVMGRVLTSKGYRYFYRCSGQCNFGKSLHVNHMSDNGNIGCNTFLVKPARQWCLHFLCAIPIQTGHSLLGIDDWYQDGVMYDVISCLNLLDRCERPLMILQQMTAKIKPVTGRIIVAIVIPFSPYVEFGNNSTRPLELLKIQGDTFEDQVQNLETNVFSPIGLEVVHWTKVPYLCEGNLQRTFYWLTDVVFILKLKPQQQFVNLETCSVAAEFVPSEDKCPSVFVDIA